MKTDMPTLVIDKATQNDWFAWVMDGPTIGKVSSLPEAVGKAAEEGTNCGYLINLPSGNQTTLGISSCAGSYQVVNKATMS
jgi:hypothetical protein